MEARWVENCLGGNFGNEIIFLKGSIIIYFLLFANKWTYDFNSEYNIKKRVDDASIQKTILTSPTTTRKRLITPQNTHNQQR